MRVLHREARRIARDVTDLDGVTGGCIATVYQFADGSVAYFALDAPAWREADEIAGWALPGRSVSWRPEGFRRCSNNARQMPITADADVNDRVLKVGSEVGRIGKRQ